MARKEDLINQISELRKELNAIIEEEETIRDAPLVGKCFIRSKPYNRFEQGWKHYIKVLKANGGLLHCWAFILRSDKGIEIIPVSYIDTARLQGNYVPITEHEFDTAWQRVVTAITEFKERDKP